MHPPPPPKTTDRIRFMIVAGEASGEMHGADLIRALRGQSPSAQAEFFGSGGAAMTAAGADILVDVRDVSIIGAVEILRGFGKLIHAYHKLRKAALTRRPDAVIFIDWPDFNLRLVKTVKRAGLRTIYYISPQIWAWKSGRARIVRQFVDKMIVILPFEVEFYQRHGIDVEFVGHPLLARVRASLDHRTFCRKYSLDPDRPIISLLPGSRHTEVHHILPILVQTAQQLASHAAVQFLVPLASTISRKSVERIISRSRKGSSTPVLTLVEHDTYNALAHSTVAAVTSGTATLEAALLETPLVVVYRGLEINWRLIRPMLRLDTFSLVNLIAGRRIVPELIQHEFTPDHLADRLLDLLYDQSIRHKMKEGLRTVRQRLGDRDATDRAAEIILRSLGSNC